MLTDFNWLCNLAFSCVASLRTNFIEISLPHTSSNVLSGEELDRLDFNEGSSGVCFVYHLFRLQLYKNYCSFSPQSYFVKGSYKNFSLQLQRNLSFLRIFCGYLIFHGCCEILQLFAKKLHQRRLIRFLIRLCLCKMTNQKLDTYTLMSIRTSKNGL